MNNNVGEKFLLKIYKDILKNSDKVQHGKYSKDAIKNIKRYMDRLESAHKHALDNNHLDLLKEYYYRNYVIKEENINRDTLYGETIENVILKQRHSLEKWIEYLVSDYLDYPVWAKYWAFQGMLKMGVYDGDKKIFNRRTKNTTKPFIDCNMEILSHTLDLIIKYNHNHDLNDEKVEKLVSTGSFSKIYGKLYKEAEEKKRMQSFSKEGIWIKYNQGNEDDAQKLFDSLQGYSTGWCTADSIDISKKQLCGNYSGAPNGGDFYVYYTKNENGKYEVPRIAIRMSGNDDIGEIRGILSNQCLEEGLEEIIEQKLDNMSNLNKKVRDKALTTCTKLKILSNIVSKTHNKELLNSEESILLYDGRIVGFGWEQDGRITETIEKRIKYNLIKSDLALLDCISLKCIMNNNYIFLKYISKDLSEYREICIESVQHNLNALEYISDEIKDYNFFLEVSKCNGSILKYVPENLIDYKLCMKSIMQNGLALEFVPKDIENYSKLVYMAVKQNGCSIQFVPKDIDNYEDIVIESVYQNGLALYYIPKNINNYNDVILEAVKSDGLALQYVSRNIDNYKKIAIEAVRQNGYAIQYVPKDIENYKDIVVEAVRQNGYSLYWVPDEEKDFYTCILAVNQNGLALPYIPFEVDDYDLIALKAVIQNGKALQYVPDKLKNYEMCIMAAKSSSEAFKFMPNEFINYDFFIDAVKQNGCSLKGIPIEFIDYTMCFEAVNQTSEALQYVPDNMKDYKICYLAVNKDLSSIKYVPKEIKTNILFNSVVMIVSSNFANYINKLSLKKEKISGTVINEVVRHR